MSVIITTFIAGREIPRRHVLDWERRRARVVLKRLGGKPAGNENLDILRQQLSDRKAALGSDGMLQLLRGELRIAQPLTHALAYLSCGWRRFSVTELLVQGGSAEAFSNWFLQRVELNDEAALLAACPDHYLIRTDAQGGQEVVETTGGSPLASRFTVDYRDLSSLRSQADPSFPYQAAGVARAANGLAIGGVRHQFRDEAGGFRARLTVEFPGLILPGAVAAHRWHLACEFGNWIEAAFRG